MPSDSLMVALIGAVGGVSTQVLLQGLANVFMLLGVYLAIKELRR